MNKLRAIAALVLVPLLAGGAANSCGTQQTPTTQQQPVEDGIPFTFTAIAYGSDKEIAVGFPAGIIVDAYDVRGNPVALGDKDTGEENLGIEIDDAELPYHYTFWTAPGLASVEFSASGILGPGQSLVCNLQPGVDGGLGAILDTDQTPFAAGPAGVTCKWRLGM